MPEIRHFPESLIPAPNPVQFRCEEFNVRTEFQPHSHTWGQLMWVKAGVMVLRIGGQRFLAPPEFVLWTPAGIEHSCYNQRLAQCRMVDIAPALCAGMPADPCLVNVTPIFRAIAEDFYARKQYIPQTEADLRLCQVLIDQLHLSPRQQTYLPSSDDKFLAPVLEALEHCPADNTSLATWAKRVYTTERTLSRRCQQDLGMPFSEWRQRLRFLHAVSLLEQGKTVQDVALEVGYSSASAFIVMFQQIAGTTPERFRRA
ncbi:MULTISPECIES: AraC family transcriptional regulator [Serratia]|uniref:AraC family transcriptional regulator n=1 Tax=Serratia TaxID=613 RepID=UPI0015F4AEB6|nr:MULTISPECIES: helix-turn-helix transcriptional regulator [Serratia]MCH6192245.1 helix-turn-helix transcriptional regulator [Serratia sp. X10]UUW17024.1 helix-turn-helix transcriptional regulator [Serratia ureilytica]